MAGEKGTTATSAPPMPKIAYPVFSCGSHRVSRPLPQYPQV
ncbi:hypothetical protein [Nonomuraea sp. KM90]